MKNTIKNKYSILIITLFTFTVIFSSCSKDDDTTQPLPVEPVELITTIHLLVTDSATSVTDTVTFRDTDGPGGNVPFSDSLFLEPNRVYNIEIVLLDESKTPADTISNEVMEEGDTHLFVFQPSPATGFIQVNITDVDDNNQPLGLHARLASGNASSGNFRVSLRHYLSAADKAQGTSGYETDIDVTFESFIQ
jgi:hypothetical protein